jgi:hypothetical protein
MPSAWSNVNTCFEIGLEVLRMMTATGATKGESKGTEVEKLTDGAILVSNKDEILIAIDKSAAEELLSEEAIKHAHTKGWFLCFPGAAMAIPMYELSRNNPDIRDLIVSEESLRATLCGNYPEYVKTHNMNVPPGEPIEDADAPPYLFLQKQLDNAADETRSQVADYQAERDHEATLGRGIFDDVLELER